MPVSTLLMVQALLLGCVVLPGSIALGQNLVEAGHPISFSRSANEAQSSVPQRPANDKGRARVSLRVGGTTVVANGSSLNEIVRQVAAVNGMKVIGTIQDEPVFGTYGPSDVSVVLSVLLEGSDTNLLIQGGRSKLPQIILTPRNDLRSVASGKAIGFGNVMTPRFDPKGGSLGHPPAELPERAREDKPPAAGMPNGIPAMIPAATNAATELPRSPNGVKLPAEIQAQLARLNETVISTRQGTADPADNRL